MVGSSLRQFEKQYVCTRDESGTWRIVDFWHKELEGVDLEDDIPDNHPAIKIVTEGEFLELINESKRLGMMQKMEESGDFSISANAYDSVCEERDRLKMQLEEKEDSTTTIVESDGSESFQLANKKLDTLLKLSSLGTLNEDLTKAVLLLGGNTELTQDTNNE